MESFWRRLKYYGIGFGIGLILTFGFFNTRGCSWMPSNRVKESMNARIWIMDSKLQKDFFQKNNLNNQTFYDALQEASIHFKASKRHGDHKIYQLEIENKKGAARQLLARMTNESALVEFIPTTKNWQAYLKSHQQPKTGAILFMPKQSNLFYIPENKAVKEKLALVGIQNDQQLNSRLKKSLFSYLNSNLKATPKPIIAFDISPLQQGLSSMKQSYQTVFCIWYKDKLKVFDLE